MYETLSKFAASFLYPLRYILMLSGALECPNRVGIGALVLGGLEHMTCPVLLTLD